MRPPRMTTRRWMIAVALVAVGLGTLGFAKRSSYCARRAAYHREREKICRQIISDVESGRAIRADPFEFTEYLRSRLLPYHADMRRKYEFAMRCPWLPIEPEPPESEYQRFPSLPPHEKTSTSPRNLSIEGCLKYSTRFAPWRQSASGEP
jgi:hypothetical protein